MGISREQALDCFRSDDLVGIGMEADAVRRRLHPEGVVSYVIGCSVDCAAVMADGGYEAIGESVELGGTGVRLGLGGVDCDAIEAVLRGIRQRFPAVWIEGRSAADLVSIARSGGLGLRETITRLRDAGLDSFSGEGVDLADGVHAGRCGVQQWIEVHRAAHGLGMRTTAAMTFGASETLEQRVDFLEAVRRLQEETGGFAAFVPMAADAPGGRELDGVTAVERLKTLAISRMFLDSVENVQAIGAAQGIKVLQMALRFGANDAGSVMKHGDGSEEDLRRIIRDAGFVPVQRDMVYRTMFLN